MPIPVSHMRSLLLTPNQPYFYSSSLQEALSQVSQASGSQVRGQPSRTPSQVTVLSTSASLLVRNGSAQMEGCPDKASTVGVTSLQDDFGMHRKIACCLSHHLVIRNTCLLNLHPVSHTCMLSVTPCTICHICTLFLIMFLNSICMSFSGINIQSMCICRFSLDWQVVLAVGVNLYLSLSVYWFFCMRMCDFYFCKHWDVWDYTDYKANILTLHHILYACLCGMVFLLSVKLFPGGLEVLMQCSHCCG